MGSAESAESAESLENLGKTFNNIISLEQGLTESGTDSAAKEGAPPQKGATGFRVNTLVALKGEDRPLFVKTIAGVRTAGTKV